MGTLRCVGVPEREVRLVEGTYEDQAFVQSVVRDRDARSYARPPAAAIRFNRPAAVAPRSRARSRMHDDRAAVVPHAVRVSRDSRGHEEQGVCGPGVSRESKVNVGLTQGSALSPLFFIAVVKLIT